MHGDARERRDNLHRPLNQPRNESCVNRAHLTMDRLVDAVAKTNQDRPVAKWS